MIYVCMRLHYNEFLIILLYSVDNLSHDFCDFCLYHIPQLQFVKHQSWEPQQGRQGLLHDLLHLHIY